ncbi:MAG: MraY family glycosyltransferase [Alphaproteobacteria bacterium]
MPFRKAARLLGIVDTPGGRKRHTKAIPHIGGLVIFSVFLGYGLFSEIVDLKTYWPLFVSLTVLLISGAIDDQFFIPARLKFFIHIFAACFIVFAGGVKTSYLGNLLGLGDMGTDFMAYPFTIIAVVLLINALNLMDGMDGLAAGVSCVMFFWLMVGALSAGWVGHASVLSLLLACIAGFLIFNMRNPLRRKASLFLGDAGSMSLGLTIAWFAVLLAQKPYVPIEPIAVAWIIGFPIFDTCAQFYRRVMHGRDPFAPDRGHFHHHFIEAGVPVVYATPIILCIVGVMGAIGYGGLMIGVPQVVLTFGWIGLLVFHIVMTYDSKRYVRLIRYFTKNHGIKACVDKG